MIDHKQMRYVHGISRKPLPEGRVLVHNHVIPQPRIGMNGFRAWTQLLAGRFWLLPRMVLIRWRPQVGFEPRLIELP